MAKLKRKDKSPYYYVDEVVDGLRIYRSTKCKTLREAEKARLRIIDEALAEHAQRTAEEEGRRAAAEAGVVTFSQVAGRYEQTKLPQLDPAWAKTVRVYLGRICDVVGPDTDFSEIGISDVAEFLDAWLDQELAPATLNRMLSTFRRLHNVAADEWELPVRRIAWGKLSLKEPRERVRWIGRQSLEQLLAELPEESRDIVLWSVLTGCRRRETLTLTWHRVDLDRRVAEVNTKGGGTRLVTLSPDAVALLNRIGERRPQRFGRVFDATGLRRRFREAVDKIGLEDFVFHDLRHTFAVYLVADGVPIQTIQKALGHTQVATTQRYAHVRREDVERAVSSMTSTAGLIKVTHSVTHFSGVDGDAPGLRS